jgi:lipase (class 3)
MITDHDIAALCAAIYAPPGQLPAAWDQLELPADGIAFGIKDLGAAVALVFRGSVTVADWLCDAETVADPFEHAGLGPVHPGFFAGLPELWMRLKQTLTAKPCIVAGHSLGAGRASLFTGLMVLDGHTPLRRLCFGEPRPGFPKAASIVAAANGRSYRNGNGRAHDLVTDVPFTTFIEDYVHPTPLAPVCAPPSDADVQRDALFAWHSMTLYASVTPALTIM